LIGWLHDGTRFSARTLLCPRLIRGSTRCSGVAFSYDPTAPWPIFTSSCRSASTGRTSISIAFASAKRTTRATPWRARLPRCTGNQADGLALSHQAFADALVLFTDPRGRAGIGTQIDGLANERPMPMYRHRRNEDDWTERREKTSSSSRIPNHEMASAARGVTARVAATQRDPGPPKSRLNPRVSLTIDGVITWRPLPRRSPCCPPRRS